MTRLMYAHVTLAVDDSNPKYGVIRSWVIEQCPLCGKRHTHGAGVNDQDPETYLFTREPHCIPRRDRRGNVIWQPPTDVTLQLTRDENLNGREVELETL